MLKARVRARRASCVDEWDEAIENLAQMAFAGAAALFHGVLVVLIPSPIDRKLHCLYTVPTSVFVELDGTLIQNWSEDGQSHDQQVVSLTQFLEHLKIELKHRRRDGRASLEASLHEMITKIKGVKTLIYYPNPNPNPKKNLTLHLHTTRNRSSSTCGKRQQPHQKVVPARCESEHGQASARRLACHGIYPITAKGAQRGQRLL